MTVQEILDMENRVELAKSLSDDLTTAKQSLSWLDSGEPIRHAFYWGPCTPSSVIDVPPELADKFRSILREHFSKRVADLAEAFDKMTFSTEDTPDGQ